MTRSPRVNVLGVSVTGVDLGTAADQVIDAACEREPLGVSAIAVHGVMSAVADPELRYRINDLEMALPDGQPVRWAMNWLHGMELSDRVPGPDLMWEVCRRAASEGLGVFLYGSTDDTLRLLERRLVSAFPGLHVSGSQASRFRPATVIERAEDLERIADCGASVVFVGLGCPRQEIWTYENRIDLSTPVLGVGAAFDYHAGRLRRAPHWMGRAGLEWAYRFTQEPRRLAGRYLKLNPAFLALLALQRAGLRDFPDSQGVTPPEQIRPS